MKYSKYRFSTAVVNSEIYVLGKRKHIFNRYYQDFFFFAAICLCEVKFLTLCCVHMTKLDYMESIFLELFFPHITSSFLSLYRLNQVFWINVTKIFHYFGASACAINTNDF